MKTVLRYLTITTFLLTTLSACAGPEQTVQGTAAQDNQIQTKNEANGIQVVRIGHAVNGMMLDLRYRITDFKRAHDILKQNTPLSIVDQATGRVLTVAESGKVGKLRNIPQTDDAKIVYWMFFVNSGGIVKSGSKVALRIGDVQIKDITVE